MSTRPNLCFLAFPLLGCALLSGCGLSDTKQVDCGCTENMLPAFQGECVSTEQHSDSGNPLTTRLPDCPSGTLLFLRERTEPSSVLFNVKTIFQNTSSSQYMEQLTEDFLFVPDREDIDLHPEIYQIPPDYDPDRDTLWTWEQERNFAVEVLNPTRFQKIDFIRWYSSSKDEIIFSEDGLLQTYIFPYEIDLSELSSDGAVNSFGLKGQMEVDLVTPTQENPVWAIQRWKDFRDPASAKLSWGELRAEFSR